MSDKNKKLKMTADLVSGLLFSPLITDPIIPIVSIYEWIFGDKETGKVQKEEAEVVTRIIEKAKESNVGELKVKLKREQVDGVDVIIKKLLKDEDVESVIGRKGETQIERPCPLFCVNSSFTPIILNPI